MKALLVDAYDSFVYVIYQYFMALDVAVDVVRNDKISLAAIEKMAPDFIVLGPGPGHPSVAHYVEIIQRYGSTIPILGVCLGHQAIGLAYGGEVNQASHIMHGKISLINHDGKGCFSGVANPFKATRYHSLIVEESSLPACLTITATSNDDQYIMGLRHKDYPMESVQFHPESICTESGMKLFENFIATYVRQ